MADPDGPRGRSPGPSEDVRPESTVSRDSLTTVSFEDTSRSTSAMTSPLSADFRSNDTDDVPKFPTLSRETVLSDSKRQTRSEDDDEVAVPVPFQRSHSPSVDLKRNKGAEYGKVGDQGVCKMHKFSLYETAMRYYLVGADVMVSLRGAYSQRQTTKL